MKTHFLQAWVPAQVNMFTNSNENKTYVYFSALIVPIVYFQISNTFLPEFVNILLCVEANRVQCMNVSLIFINSKLDY